MVVTGASGNRPPTAVADSISTSQNTPVTLAVTANDTDFDGTVNPATVDLDPNVPGRQTTISVAGQGTFITDEAGNVTFTPQNGFTGISAIAYTVMDDQGALFNPASIIVTVTGTNGNLPPTAVADCTSTAQDTSVTLAVTENDSDPDGVIDQATVDLDPVTPGRQTTMNAPAQGTFVASDTGNVTFTPETGFTGISAIFYVVQDDQGAVSNPANIIIIVAGSTNQPPVAVDDLASTLSATPITLLVTANDIDSDGTINLATVDLDPSLPGRQTTMRVPAQGIFIADEAGFVTFTPEPGFIGISTIAYHVQDDQGTLSNPASIIITVTETSNNQPPTAVADNASTPHHTPVTLAVTENDIDLDGTVDPATVDLDPNTAGRQLTVSVSGQGTFVVDEDGRVTFTPVLGFTGTTAISYRVRDNRGAQSNPANITVTVGGNNGFNPPLGLKFVNPANLPELEWRMVWINHGNPTATAVRVTDNVPSGTIFVPDSLTCEVQGSSTIDRCAFEAEANQVIYEGTLGADLSALTEADASHEVVLTYRVTVVPLGFFGLVENQALANWDADGSGTPADEIAALQPPALSDDPTTVAPFDPTVVNIPPAPGACLFQVRPVLEFQSDVDIEPESIDNPDEGAFETRTTRQETLIPPVLTPPLANQSVAGSSVAVAAIPSPDLGHRRVPGGPRDGGKRECTGATRYH